MSIKAMQQALDSLDEIRILLWKESRVFSHVHSSIDSLRIAIEDEKRRLLSTTEPTQNDEPVATLDHNGNFKLLRMVGVTVGQPINLYERPAPQKPFVWLSDDEIIEAYKNTPVKGALAYFIAGVRLAESKYNEEKQ